MMKDPVVNENGTGPPQKGDDAQTVAMEWKNRGNNYFYGGGQFSKAAEAYQMGIKSLHPEVQESDGEVDDQELFTDPSPDRLDLELSLRCNMAMAQLKLEDFAQAEYQCSWVLQRQPTNFKALYRRALAREGALRKSPELPPHEQLQRYAAAMDDLRQCLKIAGQHGNSNSRQVLKVRSAANKALARLEQYCLNIREQKRQTGGMDREQHVEIVEAAPTNGKSNPSNGRHHEEDSAIVKESSSTSNGNRNPAKTVPSPPQQKQDVIRLLLARQLAGSAVKGEAFFLIDWKWWCQWCEHVDFFYTQNKDEDGGDQMQRQLRVLRMLPPGAVLPEFEKEKDSDSEESSDEDDIPQTLGVIDNSRLLLDQTVFHRQWYLHSGQNHAVALKPNLVRGYHFELLPREVYNALRTWYGETTPSICRRSNKEGIVRIYPPETTLPLTTERTSSTPKCSACRAPGASSRCKRCMSVQYCNQECQLAHWPYHKPLCKQATANGTKIIADNRLSGRVGLNNVGNTCFMNSSLQALSHATPLTRHFLSNKFRADLNTTNPLGTGGKLAQAYDSLLKELWMRTTGSSLSPTSLKRAIAVFAPRFAGCLQHDAQEFLAYLLDGLHEDLNRIRKAPYVEMPDVTDGQNMAIASAEAWDAHKRRNDSFLLDNFYGQYQSTCICPQCHRVSVSFDAFNHVSLEIPQTQKATITIQVLVFRKPTVDADSADIDRTPYRYALTLRRQGLVLDLKQALSEMVGVPSTHLVMADIYNHSIYEVLNDKKPLSNFRPNDVIAAFEVEPYSNTRIHVLATHSLLMRDKSGKLHRPLFGFPFMTSFETDLTCRQVWDHIWDIVGHFVQKGGNGDYVDGNGMYRREDILTIRAVNSQGRPISVFSTDSGDVTPVLPFDASETIKDCLDEEYSEKFLFLSLEWTNPGTLREISPEDDDDQDEAEADAHAGEKAVISPQVFMAYKDHESLLEAARQQRAKKNGVKGVTLDQCLQAFTKPERLDEHNKWYCSNCKEHVRAMKTMKLCRLPNILVVHLKRFEFKHGMRREKLDTHVTFPLEGLDMTPHCSFWNKGSTSAESIVDTAVEAEYDLFAVVNHYGRMGFGHYTAFCRQWDESGLSTEWYLFDDSNVRPMNSSEVVSPSAYVLFYRRRRFN